MNGEPPRHPSTTQTVLHFIQRNRDRPPTIVNIAERLHCSPPIAYDAVKELLRSGKLGTRRTNGTIVYVAQTRH